MKTPLKLLSAISAVAVLKELARAVDEQSVRLDGRIDRDRLLAEGARRFNTLAVNVIGEESDRGRDGSTRLLREMLALIRLGVYQAAGRLKADELASRWAREDAAAAEAGPFGALANDLGIDLELPILDLDLVGC